MLKRFAFLLCAVALAVAGANYFFLQRPLGRVAGIDVAVHYRFFVDPRTLIYDLQDVPQGTRPEDVTRMLVQFASVKKARAFDEVRLYYQGKEKLVLTGGDFQKLGMDPAAMLPALPARLATPDGRRVKDFTAWHRAWYIDELTEKIRAAMEQAA